MIKKRISIIGAGKVGSAIACILATKGYEIFGVFSKSLKSAKRLADRVKAKTISDIDSIPVDVDIVLITTPDSEIDNIVQSLTLSPRECQGKFIFHTCGSQSSDVLGGLRGNGWQVGSLHPLQAFADIETAMRILPNAYFAIDGDVSAQEVAKQMVRDIGGKSFYVPSQKRALYHAAACMASNYTVTLIHAATQLLAEVGISDNEAITALTPLMQGSFMNIQEQGTVKALTGPIVRGDVLTIAKHQEAIKDFSPQEIEIYKTLGQYAHNIAKQRNCLSKEQDRVLTDIFQ